mgnify:CR=1 FL=1
MAGEATMRLYTGPLSMFGAKAEIALIEKGIGFERIAVPFGMQVLYTPKHAEVARINPKRQVPVLVHGDLELFDSTQIFEYIEDVRPDPPLWPRDIRQRARARQLELIADEVYFPHVIRLFGLQEAPEDAVTIAAKAAAAEVYGRMEAALAGRDFLAGAFGYADIALFMAQLFGERMGVPLTDATPQLLAWRHRVGERPPVAQVAGEMGGYLIGEGRPVPAFLREIMERRARG